MVSYSFIIRSWSSAISSCGGLDGCFGGGKRATRSSSLSRLFSENIDLNRVFPISSFAYLDNSTHIAGK